MSKSTFLTTVAAVLALGSAFLLFGCGSSNSTTNANMAGVNVTISDPSTCSAPQGPFSHVFVTITDVQISSSSTAGANDSSFVDLTPSLKQNPMQVDLLAQANNQCFLATLG